jgi:hypothetical protein
MLLRSSGVKATKSALMDSLEAKFTEVAESDGGAGETSVRATNRRLLPEE